MHIMSSMIPIFIMPIAVLDSIHILSEFFEKYQKIKSRKKTLLYVMDDLFTPMFYTSLTSFAGFASLALTPIPPVQVFGIFVAAGIMIYHQTLIFNRKREQCFRAFLNNNHLGAMLFIAIVLSYAQFLTA